MRRRARDNESGSLDLLLDTICNTFGGILLISLLVIVLLNTSVEESEQNPTEQSQVELAETAIKQQEISAKITRLQRAVTDAEKTKVGLISDELFKLAREVKVQKDLKARLAFEKAETTQELATIQSNVNQVITKNQQAAKRLAVAENKLKALILQVEEEVEKRSRKAVIPKVERSTRIPRTYFLTGGKLYGPVRKNSGAWDNTQVLATGLRSNSILKPNPSGGIRVPTNRTVDAALRNRFKDISSTANDVQLFVWPDSFDKYEVVRSALDSLSIKCDLRPMDKAGEVGVGSGQSSQRFAQ